MARALIWGACLGVAGCGEQAAHYQRLAGATMGTQYRITADCPVPLGAAVEAELQRVNGEMSTYDSSSTLSRFNQWPPGPWFAVSPELVRVVAAATQLSAQSDGVFDVTVGPLVNLWGFGPEGSIGAPPAQAQIDTARARVGYTYLEHRPQPPALRKRADVYVDLSAIAKGHGVDRLAALLLESGCAHFLVEIGGELRTHGLNDKGHPWRVGVEVPDPTSFGAVQRVLQPGESSVATSGDYRNFLEKDGVRFSHTIDPRTGRPVNHRLASVTVAHESAMWADGYASLLSVLGPQAGFAFAEDAGLAALFIERTDNGFEERYTAPMQSLLGVH